MTSKKDSEGKHDVGRWRRGTGKGKGIGSLKRDRDRESEIAHVESSHDEIEILSNPQRSLDLDAIETLSNPKRSLNMDVNVIKSVGADGYEQGKANPCLFITTTWMFRLWSTEMTLWRLGPTSISRT